MTYGFNFEDSITYKDVFWGSPVSYKCALGDCGYLDPNWHCILAVVFDLVILNIATGGDNAP